MPQRKAPVLIWRALVGLSIFAAGWAPAAIITVWGGAYFLRCVYAMTAPGVPIEYRYESEIGTMLVRADGYQFDPEKREGFLTRVSVTTPKGDIVAKCAIADFSVEGGVFVLRIPKPEFFVKRLPDGSFDVQRMLPTKVEEEAGEAAFRIAFVDATVIYSDDVVSKEPVVFALKQCVVDASKGVFAFRADLSTQGIDGHVNGAFTESDGLRATLAVQDSDLAGSLPFVNRFLDERVLGEFAHVDADELKVNGEITILAKEDSPTRLSGAGRIVARGVDSPQTFRNASLLLDVHADGTNMLVKGSANQRGLDSKFDGTAHFGEKFRLIGVLDAKIASLATTPPQITPFLPEGATFEDASLVGTLDTDFEKYTINGSLSAKTIEYGGETATQVDSQIQLNERGLVAQVDEGHWGGIEATGAVQIDFETKKVGGGFQSRRGRLEPVAKHLGTKNLTGIVSASAVLGGTMDDLYADIYARGSGGVQLGDGPIASMGVYELRGRLDAKRAKLDRLEINGPTGLFVASGTMDWETGGLDFRAQGGGIELASLTDDAKGTGYLNVQIGGTRESPTVAGRMEVYGVEAYGRKIPQAIADFISNGKTLDIGRFALRAGSGQIDGAARVDFGTRAIDGTYQGQGVRLEEWLSPETVGSADIVDGKVIGTIENPVTTGKVVTSQVFAGGVDVKSSSVPYLVDRDHAETSGFAILVDNGSVEGAANYAFKDSTGSVRGSFRDLPLEHAAIESENVTLDGLVSGNFEATVGDGKWNGRISSDLRDVAVNKTLVGQGWLEASLEDKRIKLDGQVGSIDRYVLVEEASYDLGKQELQGDVLVYNVLIKDVLAAAKKPMSEFPERVRDVAENTEGLLNAEVSLGGTVDDPLLDVKSASMTDLKLRGRDAGALKLSADRRTGAWNVSQFNWEQGDTRFAATGSITESGNYDLTGDLNNFDASWIHTWMPDAPLFTGGVDVSFKSFGSFENPMATATLVAHDLGYYDGANAVKLPLAIELDEVTVGDRKVDVHGQTFYKGLSAELVGSIPFAGLYGEAEDRDVSLVATIEDRPLGDLKAYFPSIDAERTVGRISGTFGVRGDWETLEPFADLQSSGTVLTFEGQTNILRDFVFAAKLDDTDASLNGAFAGGSGGRGFIDAKATLPTGLVRGDVDRDALMGSQVSGSVKLDGIALRMTLPTAERASRALVSTRDFNVSGTLGHPVLTGEVLFHDLYVRLPNELEESKAPTIYAIDPTFEGVTVTAAPGSVMDSGNARIEFEGRGRLGGSLQNPDVSLPLKVSGGVFELPTARIDLESNGDIIIGYRAAFGTAPTARVDLRLEGNTTVSARRVDNQYETYPVQLDIRGNLLEENGITIFAVSDPPDLTSDQILALLGRKELIESFARSGGAGDVRESIYTAAFPAAANLITADLARSLGLDYISLDYNPLDQASAGFGKSLGDGLMFHAVRQLSSSAGERLKYDVQLTYRLPMEDRFFNRMRLGLGFDQDVAWRVRLNWARRF